MTQTDTKFSKLDGLDLIYKFVLDKNLDKISKASIQNIISNMELLCEIMDKTGGWEMKKPELELVMYSISLYEKTGRFLKI